MYPASERNEIYVDPDPSYTSTKNVFKNKKQQKATLTHFYTDCIALNPFLTSGTGL
jgi:hypothetical protein